IHIFIDKTYVDTKKSRSERGRETQDEFLERILKIEHGIISKQKMMADIIITRNYSVEKLY
ncbi:uridine kinase, partial [candidate division WOR-3 bacterium]|nr:uridine kinase [candidate division WOR-3 bacterium]